MGRVLFGSWARVVSGTVIGFTVTCASAAIQFGGLTFDDNAFSDKVLSTDFTGAIGGCSGSAPANLDQAIAGYHMNTWIDYGTHDMVPGLDGDYNSSAPPYQYIELAFTDNVVVNQPGNDLAIFERSTPNSTRVALNKTSIQKPYAPGSSSVVAVARNMPAAYSNGCTTVSVAYVDLSALGVPEGASVYRIFLSSPLMENGDVAWRNVLYPMYGVPELVGAAALHSAAKGNYAPEVNAGADTIISMPNQSVTLSGEVLDDGLPSNTLTSVWAQVGGPAAIISNPSSPVSQVTFAGAGTYSFQLTANDGGLSRSDVVTVVVTAPDSSAPSAPANFTAQTLSNTGVSMTWAASADNVAVRRYRIYRDNELLTTTTDLFYKDFRVAPATSHWYSVQAEDPAGNLSAQSAVETVTLSQPLLAVQISSRTDDAEEAASGAMGLTDGDLELVQDGSRGAQHVGLRFQNVGLPVGAQIVKAWLEFTVDETSSEATNLIIRGLAQDAPATFASTAFDISSRLQTAAFAQWSGIEPWTVVGNVLQTPTIADVVQELVYRPSWQSGNAMGFVVTGTGRRVAESYEGLRASAPKLFVEYVLGVPVNKAPTVNAGVDASLVLPDYELSLAGSSTDDGFPYGSTTSLWEQISGPAVVAFANSSDSATTATFSAAGVYTLRLSASDGELSNSDDVTITVYPPDTTAPSIPAITNASVSGAGTVTINWAAASDDVGIKTYRVYRDGVEIAQTTALSYQNAGLEPLTQYGYQIQAEDLSGNLSDLSETAYVTTPEAQLPTTEVSIRVVAAADDAEEESSTGRVSVGSKDLDFVYEAATGNQLVGLRFLNVPLPQGAIVVNAWLEFETAETGAGATSLNIAALAHDNTPTFTTAAFNVSTRTTIGSVLWDQVPAWTMVDEIHQTPNIASLVQSVVDMQGWASGNAMGFVITGSGTRTAKSFNADRTSAPVLRIQYR